MTGRSRKITYSAAALAISAVFIALSAFTPAKIVPLIAVSLSLYIVFIKSGFVYGIITMLLSLFICFLMGGGFVSPAFIFTAAVFAPYSLYAFFMRKIRYGKVRYTVIRIAASAVFFFAAASLLAIFLSGLSGTSFYALLEKLSFLGNGAWALAAVLITVAALPADFFFCFVSDKVLKAIK